MFAQTRLSNWNNQTELRYYFWALTLNLQMKSRPIYRLPSLALKAEFSSSLNLMILPEVSTVYIWLLLPFTT